MNTNHREQIFLFLASKATNRLVSVHFGRAKPTEFYLISILAVTDMS